MGAGRPAQDPRDLGQMKRLGQEVHSFDAGIVSEQRGRCISGQQDDLNSIAVGCVAFALFAGGCSTPPANLDLAREKSLCRRRLSSCFGAPLSGTCNQ